MNSQPETEGARRPLLNIEVDMKIKNLPRNTQLRGIKFKHPDTEKTCVWWSSWNRGVWYKNHENDLELHIIEVNDIKDALEFEVV